jgi:hypothetical protein
LFFVFSSNPSNDSSLSESENTMSSRDLSFSFAAFHFDYFIIFLNPTIYFSELCASSVVMIFLGGDLNHISLLSLPLSLLWSNKLSYTLLSDLNRAPGLNRNLFLLLDRLRLDVYI